MVLQYLLAQGSHVYMGIDFGGANGLVAKHSLDGTEVGTAFQQGCSERVAQSVGGNGLLDACLDGLSLNHDEYHGACEMSSTAIKENIVFLAGLDIHVTAVVKPESQFLDGFGRDGYQTFLGTFSEDADVLFVEEEV